MQKRRSSGGYPEAAAVETGAAGRSALKRARGAGYRSDLAVGGAARYSGAATAAALGGGGGGGASLLPEPPAPPLPAKVWGAGDQVEVLWRGKPHDAVVRAVDTGREQALVAYSPPHDQYPDDWLALSDLRAPFDPHALPPHDPALEHELRRRLLPESGADGGGAEPAVVVAPAAEVHWLTTDRRTWVLVCRGWDGRRTAAEFEEVWREHPAELGRNVLANNRTVITPRFWAAFGRDYQFSGQTASAAPLHELPAVPPLLRSRPPACPI